MCKKITLEDVFNSRREIEIERSVHEVHADVWRRRHELWNGNLPEDLIGYLEPGVALKSLGYRVSQVSVIGEMLTESGRCDVAGEINTRTKIVKVSEMYLMQERRFTLAHETGHAILHPDMGVMHRDVPFEKSGVVSDYRENEANRFGSGYLMPWRIMHAQYDYCFGEVRVEFTERIAHGVFGMDAASVRRQCRAPRDISLSIARATRFGKKHFRSLAEQFKVTPTVMAIRLEELGLFKQN